jgi:hypothetical protein
MIRLPAPADRMHKSTDRPSRDELIVVPQDMCDGIYERNVVLRTSESWLIYLVYGENETLHSCCEIW